MPIDRKIIKWVLLLFAFLFGCNGGTVDEKGLNFTTLQEVNESAWKKLAVKKIYLGHQSVGFNIIQGINDIMDENPYIRLNIVETSDPKDFDEPIFAHSRIGNNTDPKSKCDAFTVLMQQGIGHKADIAFFKFCYVDVTAKTNIENIFLAYKNTMSRLKETYPKTTFIHVTVPLTSKETGIDGLIKKTKDFVKKIIRRSVFNYYDNIKRNQLNEMLRKEYAGKEPMFDLATIESTFPDGKRSYFSRGGKIYYSLVPEYTYDGGHLNKRGRTIVAEQLLVLLADLSK